MKHDQLVLIHTPHLSDKAHGTKTVLEVLAGMNVNPDKIWIDHVEENGFRTEAQDVSSLHLIKREKGVAAQYQSCHTAVHQSGLVFEGHVPAEAMTRLIENPINESIGLAVPGMPVGSPGMEYNNRIDSYEIKLLLKDGSSKTYAYVDRSGIKYQD